MSSFAAALESFQRNWTFTSWPTMRLPHFPHPSTYRTDCPIGNRRRHLRTLLPTLPFPPPPAAPLFLAPPAALSICRYTTQDTRYKIQDIWPMGQFLWQGKLIPAFVHALRLIAWPGYKLKHTRTDTYPTHSHTPTSHTRTHTHTRAHNCRLWLRIAWQVQV